MSANELSMYSRDIKDITGHISWFPSMANWNALMPAEKLKAINVAMIKEGRRRHTVNETLASRAISVVENSNEGYLLTIDDPFLMATYLAERMRSGVTTMGFRAGSITLAHTVPRTATTGSAIIVNITVLGSDNSQVYQMKRGNQIKTVKRISTIMEKVSVTNPPQKLVDYIIEFIIMTESEDYKRMTVGDKATYVAWALQHTS